MNRLLKSRWDSRAHFELYAIADPQALLDTILLERRKELLMRGIRWSDIKRLNQKGRNIVLRRKLDDCVIELLPHDLRYALPIPEDIISISGMQQNPR